MKMQNGSRVKSLRELEYEEEIRQIPLMVYLIVLCLSGIVGNTLVCYINARKKRLSTFRLFVIVLASVDLFTSGILLPAEVVIQFWQYTYYNVWICKLNLFAKVWTAMASGFLLLCIAIDRYRKVCRPFRMQISIRTARDMCLTTGIISIAVSWISPIIYGVQTREISRYNITISECAVTENMKQTLFPLLNNFIFALLFSGALSAILIMYGFIALRVKRQIKKKIGIHTKSGGKRKTPETETKVSNKRRDDSDDGLEYDMTTSDNTLDPTITNTGNGMDIEPTKKHGSVRNKIDKTANIKHGFYAKDSQRKRLRTSLIMFMVSIAFIITYMPVLCILLIRTVDKTFVTSLTDSGRTAYKFIYRSYFISSAINPLIYGIWDASFRQSCKTLFKCRNNCVTRTLSEK
ncbi:vasopressin V1a receptor-like [Mercenaria mercenaria]|uniref:vasopressin V1a receptor-like n=1 Tax=Mercenaria mercenaria TaxID=6596 RepID=UPI00234F972A|nr:vasopressin V1a receptor-like [Mercenaria mercenaria]